MKEKKRLASLKADAGTFTLPARPVPEYAVACKLDRNDNLDRLRDIAAFVVILAHICAIWVNPILGEGESVLPKVVWATSAAAVDLFLALSGYVVALAWQRQKTRGGVPGVFYSGRLLRLMPTYLVSLAVALFCWSVLQGFQPQASAGLSLASQELAMAGVIASLAPIWPTEATSVLNPPWWTLQVEILAMLITPFVVHAGEHSGVKGITACLALTILAVVALSTIGLPGIEQAICLFTVILGIGLALHRDADKSGPPQRVFILPLIIGMIGLQTASGIVLGSMLARTASGVLAVGVIAILSRRDAPRLPKISPLKAGELSYPAYVLHYPLIALGAGIASRLEAPSSQAIIAGGCSGAAASIALAIVTAKAVERRAIRRSSLHVSRKLADLAES